MNFSFFLPHFLTAFSLLYCGASSQQDPLSAVWDTPCLTASFPACGWEIIHQNKRNFSVVTPLKKIAFSPNERIHSFNFASKYQNIKLNFIYMYNYSLSFKCYSFLQIRAFSSNYALFFIHSYLFIQISSLLNHCGLWLYGYMPLWHMVNTITFICWCLSILGPL